MQTMMTPTTNREETDNPYAEPRQTGTIKSWNDQRGYGWIALDWPEGSCALVHFSVVRSKRFRRQFAVGLRCSFIATQGSRGLTATDVAPEAEE